MVGGSAAVVALLPHRHTHGGNSYDHQCTPRGRVLHTSHNNQSIIGAFTASNPLPTSVQKSYAEAAQQGPKGKEKDPIKPVQTQPIPHPSQQSRKRADPQSDPTPTLYYIL
eukprot:scaffold249773_cov31-Tisochrysis_lutea.AAC.1